MTGDESKFISLEKKRGGKVTLGDNTTCQVLGSGTIKVTSLLTIEKVLFVEGLKHNLLSISQLCDKGFQICFTNSNCTLKLNNNINLEGFRVDNIYKINFDNLEKHGDICLKTTLDESWLWHRRLCHASMNTLRKIDHRICMIYHISYIFFLLNEGYVSISLILGITESITNLSWSHLHPKH